MTTETATESLPVGSSSSVSPSSVLSPADVAKAALMAAVANSAPVASLVPETSTPDADAPMTTEEAQKIVDTHSGKQGRPSFALISARKVLGIVPSAKPTKAPKTAKDPVEVPEMSETHAKKVVKSFEGKRGRRTPEFFAAMTLLGLVYQTQAEIRAAGGTDPTLAVSPRKALANARKELKANQKRAKKAAELEAKANEVLANVEARLQKAKAAAEARIAANAKAHEELATTAKAVEALAG